MTPEQLIQVLTQLRANEKSFAELTARFDGTRQQHKVDEFITHATIFKDINNISDENALKGLPLLLQNSASTWWDGVKSGIRTWTDACALIRRVYAPPQPDWSIFKELHTNPQKENEATDEFISKKRFLISKLTSQFTEAVQIDMIYGQLNLYIREKMPRQDVTTFSTLLRKSRVVEQNRAEFSQQAAVIPGLSKLVSATNHNNVVKCNICGLRNHTEDECRRRNNGKTPALKYISNESQMSCYGCNTPGVYRSNCTKCQTKDIKTQVNSVEFYSMRCRLGRDIPTVQIKVFGHTGTAHIDTGARTSIASSSLYRHLQNHKCKFQHCVANIMLADGSSSIQTVLTTRVNIELGDQIKSIQFTVLPQATNNRTLLGNDFLETVGIILNLAQKVWSYIQFPRKVFHYETTDAMPKATTANNRTHTSPQHPLKSVSSNALQQAKRAERDVTLSSISPLLVTGKSSISQTNSTDHHTFEKPKPSKPLQYSDQQAEKTKGSIFIEYSEENVPDVWTTPPKFKSIQESGRVPELKPAPDNTTLEKTPARNQTEASHNNIEGIDLFSLHLTRVRQTFAQIEQLDNRNRTPTQRRKVSSQQQYRHKRIYKLGRFSPRGVGIGSQNHYRTNPRYQSGDRVWVNTTHKQCNNAKQLAAKIAPMRDGSYADMRKHDSARDGIDTLNDFYAHTATSQTSTLTKVDIHDSSKLDPVKISPGTEVMLFHRRDALMNQKGSL